MNEVDEKHLDERCRTLWGKIKWPIELPPDFGFYDPIRRVDILEMGIKQEFDRMALKEKDDS